MSRVDAAAFEAATADIPDPQWIVPRVCGTRGLSKRCWRARRFSPCNSARSSRPVRPSTPASCPIASGSRGFSTTSPTSKNGRCAYLDIEVAAVRLLETDTELAQRFRALLEAPGMRYFQEKKLLDHARQTARKVAQVEALAVAKALQARATEICAGLCARPKRRGERWCFTWPVSSRLTRSRPRWTTRRGPRPARAACLSSSQQGPGRPSTSAPASSPARPCHRKQTDDNHKVG